jgi:hypothetical protein
MAFKIWLQFMQPKPPNLSLFLKEFEKKQHQKREISTYLNAL